MSFRKKLLAVFVSFFTFGTAANAATISPANSISGTGKVYRVIDGDTIDVNINSASVYGEIKRAADVDGLKYLNDYYQKFRIRLANIDTPESVHRDKRKNTKEGYAASNYLKNKIEGKEVGFECWDKGKYGRMICAVSFNGQDIGLDLISKGHSPYVTYWGKHPRMHKQYFKAAR